jgi:DNA polymerase
MTRRLHIDIETYSGESLADCGVHRYAEHPDFQILLFAYAFDEAPVTVVDLAQGATLPAPVLRALTDPKVVKVAHNATFERTCIGRMLGKELDPLQWECTMAQCARCGLPLSLGEAAKALGLEVQKMTEGKKLIKQFCLPHEATLLGGSERVLPTDDLKGWQTFKDYCRMDVEVERELDKALAWLEPTQDEKALYALDQRINDRGVLVDMQLVDNAVRMDTIYKARLNVEAQQITGLSNPNSATQLREWLGGRTGLQLDTLRKTDLPDIKGSTEDEDVHRVLQIRAEMAKTSNKKYEAMQKTVCRDSRVRGLLQYHGTRTGRWAGRLVQMQNLPQNHISDLGLARELLRDGDMDAMSLCYGNVPDTLSQLIRTAFVAPDGETFAVCDFSAIEARVLAWLAGEEWVLEVFRGHGKIYEATAAQMYGCSVEEISKTDPRRQKGKIAVLALGYQGGTGALAAMGGERMGGERMGLSAEDMAGIVRDWRKANPHIVKCWTNIETTAQRCVTTGIDQKVYGLIFHRRPEDGTMTIQLPSGRLLCYRSMTTGTNRFGNGSLKYRGVNSTTNQWGWIETYGGKLTENIVQAIARDCLAHTLLALDRNGYPTVFHVHDEVVCEVPKQEGPEALKRIQKIFADVPDWAEGLPLKGAGYVTDYYLKD